MIRKGRLREIVSFGNLLTIPLNVKRKRTLDTRVTIEEIMAKSINPFKSYNNKVSRTRRSQDFLRSCFNVAADVNIIAVDDASQASSSPVLAHKLVLASAWPEFWTGFSGRETADHVEEDSLTVCLCGFDKSTVSAAVEVLYGQCSPMNLMKKPEVFKCLKSLGVRDAEFEAKYMTASALNVEDEDLFGILPSLITSSLDEQERTVIEVAKRCQQGQFPCTECGKSFQSPSSLSQHRQIHKQADAKFECSQCNLRFKTQRYLYQHVKRRHEPKNELQLKSRKCDVCHKILSSAFDLKAHSRIHKKEKPFNCAACDSTFRFRSSLSTHFKAVHGTVDDRKHGCEFCDRRFVSVGDLRKHERNHTKEKPFQCRTCEKKFARRDYLKKHMKSIHKTEDRSGNPQRGEAQQQQQVEEDIPELLGESILPVNLESLEPGEAIELALETPAELAPRESADA